jgi:tetraacyldisaccharide 4'-kinase
VRSAPSFWWRGGRGPTALILAPLSALYGGAAGWRMGRRPRYRAPVPVVCVGNFVVGGAGKTPTALSLARIARARDLRPGFLTRGYGGKEVGPLVVDAGNHRADRVGDEALLLAAAAPTVVSRDRPKGAELLAANGVDFIIMDDGFQNPALAKDFSFVVVDAEAGIGNGMVFPAGPLRAPLKAQLRYTDALVVIGEGETADPLIRAAARAGRGILRARLKPTRVKDWRRTPILAYAGIARPEKFFASLAVVQAPVGKAMTFPDHHRYSETEAERLIGHADAAGLRLVTTEKDIARLSGAGGSLGKLRDRSDAFAVTLEFENSIAVGEIITEIAHGIAATVRA